MALMTPGQAERFRSPRYDGVMKLEGYFSEFELENMHAELEDSEKVQWWDSHATYTNRRGLLIEQNHFTYALKLDRGDQSQYQALGPLRLASEKIQRTVRGLSRVMPDLFRWTPDELSIHRYDKPTGLSRHRDHERFMGMIAIGVIEGTSKFAVYRDPTTSLYPNVPGDLLLLRAPTHKDDTIEMRPEHAVVEIETFPRTSMMLRASSRPDEIFPHYTYANWPN